MESPRSTAEEIPAASHLESPVVGNYRLVEKLGEGGMGAVYRALDVMVEREVAIKMLRPEIARQPEVVERFRSEAVALAKLNHPNIATLYSFFRQGDEYFMVMEFVAGRTLESLLRSCGAVIPQAASSVVTQVLDAIEHAHSYGILHRDIKPANIMLAESGQVKVTDFGIARVLGAPRMTRAGSIYGTLEYMAPERVRGQESDLRSDLYSVGVMFYEMLAGRLPFEADNEFDLMRAHLQEAPPTFASLRLVIPTELETVTNRALAKEPEQRYAGAREFREAITRATLTPMPPAPHPVVPEMRPAERDGAIVASEPATPVARSRTKWLVFAAAAVVVALLGILLAFWGNRKPGNADRGPSPQEPVITAPANPAVTTEAPQQEKTAEGSAAPGRQDTSATAKQNVPDPAAKQHTTSSVEADRRKAALKALEEDTAKQKPSDKRSSALKALNQ